MSDDSRATPEPPEELRDYDPGSAADAMVDEGDTRVVWIADHEAEKRWWFELSENVPVRRKQKMVEQNTTAGPDGVTIDADYYVDMLEFIIVDWSGADDPDAPGIREFLTKAYRGQGFDNPVFEDLWEEVPPPFANIPDADLNV